MLYIKLNKLNQKVRSIAERLLLQGEDSEEYAAVNFTKNSEMNKYVKQSSAKLSLVPEDIRKGNG